MDIKENNYKALSYYCDIIKNGIKRKLDKLSHKEENFTELINIENDNNSEYGLIPGSYIGKIVRTSERRYIAPESLDAKSYLYGVRNRGEYFEINSEAAPITIFNKFIDYNKELNKESTYIGIDDKGNLKLGKGEIFEKGDKVAKTFSNKVYCFEHNKDGSYKTKKDYAHGNYMRDVPIIKVKNDNDLDFKYGSLNLLFGRDENEGKTYGNTTGGRVIVEVGNEIRILSGSIKNIESEFEAMKKRQHKDYGIFYILDNGSYNRGLRTYDKKFKKIDLQKYDAQNRGGGGFLYIKEKLPNKFDEEFFKTPNIRTKESEFYKKGFSLINENKGVVLHYTGIEDDDDLEKVTSYFMNSNNKVSAHVVIGKNGNRRIFANKDEITFHSGKSFFNGRFNVNDFMHGVEFDNDGTTLLTKEQIDSFIEYITPILRENNIKLEDIVTHREVRFNYNQKVFEKKAPIKYDLNEEQYQQVIDALKNKIYYKK